MDRSRWVAAATVALLAAVPIGRTEGSRAARAQIAGIEAVREAVGPLDSPRLHAFRFDRGWACLFYTAARRYYGYELCYDQAGRLVETVDRRGGSPVFGTVASQPELAPERVRPSTVLAILRRHHVPLNVLRESGY